MLSTTDIQRAIYEQLQTQAVALGAVLDHEPDTQERSYPFVVMADHTARAWDTDSDEGLELVVTIDSWSQYVGNAEVKSMMDTIRAELNHVDLVLQETGLHCILVELVSEQVLTDPGDGLTRHGIQEFRLLVEQLD